MVKKRDSDPQPQIEDRVRLGRRMTLLSNVQKAIRRMSQSQVDEGGDRDRDQDRYWDLSMVKQLVMM